MVGWVWAGRCWFISRCWNKNLTFNFQNFWKLLKNFGRFLEVKNAFKEFQKLFQKFESLFGFLKAFQIFLMLLMNFVSFHKVWNAFKEFQKLFKKFESLFGFLKAFQISGSFSASQKLPDKILLKTFKKLINPFIFFWTFPVNKCFFKLFQKALTTTNHQLLEAT